MTLSESNRDLIYRSWVESITEEEEVYLKRLLAADTEAAAEYRRLARLYRYGRYAGKWELVDTEKAWRRIAGRSRIRKRTVMRYWTVAASVVLLAGIAFTLLRRPQPGREAPLAVAVCPGGTKAQLILPSGERIQLGEGKTQKIAEKGVVIAGDTAALRYEKDRAGHAVSAIYHELVIPRGGEYCLQLADGTVVWLNSESRLKFPVLFEGGKREVFLEGEAYFEVEASRQCPFIVRTPVAEVNVLGTGFNVMAYENDLSVQVTLVHGAVGIRTAAGQKTIRPDEQFVFDKTTGEQTVRRVKVGDFVGWKEGILSFDGMSLEELSQKLSRWYDVEFFFTAESLKQLKFSGAFRKYNNIRYVLGLIGATTDVELVLKGRTVTVSRK